MNFHVALELRGSLPVQNGRVHILHGVPRFQREFGIHHQHGTIIWHLDGAIGALSVRQGGLKFKRAHWQAVLNDRFHPALPKGPARLFILQNRLQPDHILSEVLDIVLCNVDHRQPLLQLGEIFLGGLRGLRQRLRNAMGHTCQPFVQLFCKGRLLHGRIVLHRGKPPR